jgi:hypothetical protein
MSPSKVMMTIFRKKPTYILCLIGLLCGLSQQMEAQSPQQIAIVSWVGNELNNMVSNNIGVFVAEGQGVLGSIFAILLVWYMIAGLFSQQVRNELLVELVLNFMLCQMMLTFYDSPMPWGGGMSFHQIFSKEAQWAAATLDIAVVNDVISDVTAMWQGLELPHTFDFLGYITYGWALINLAVIWLFCSGITLIAHIALGFGALMGPLVIPFFIWPVMSWLFWGWVKFMTTYALYIVSSSAVVYIYAHVMLYFFNHVVNGNYTLGNISALILPFTVLNLVFVIGFWQCHTWARDMASGSANLGSSVSGVVATAALAIAA